MAKTISNLIQNIVIHGCHILDMERMKNTFLIVEGSAMLVVLYQNKNHFALNSLKSMT